MTLGLTLGVAHPVGLDKRVMTGIHHSDVLQIASLPHNPLSSWVFTPCLQEAWAWQAPPQAGGPWGFLAVSRDPLRLHPCSWWLPWPVPWVLGLSEDLLGCRCVRLPSALPAWAPHSPLPRHRMLEPKEMGHQPHPGSPGCIWGCRSSL